VRVLMLSHFPPMRGGISAYADQAVAALRAEGHEVMVASPEPSSAEHVVDLRQKGAGRELAELASASDLLVVQFQPEMLGEPGSSRLSLGVALLRLSKGLGAAPDSDLRVHEVDYGQGPHAPLLRRLVRPVWQRAGVITVHTERERADFCRAFRIDPAKVRVASQGENMLRRTGADRAEARRSLGLPADAQVLLAIGFLQPNKGFDRALRAFAEARPDGARLYVVGSVWRDDAATGEHLAELRRLAEATDGAELREGYLDDEEFDRWIVASDALVLPYRAGWSSNVMERGLLYDRPVVMSRTGGMAEQAVDRPGVTLVDDDAQLVEALRSRS
jgi:glycosyltransferase involved in cell wall biosynthesis